MLPKVVNQKDIYEYIRRCCWSMVLLACERSERDTIEVYKFKLVWYMYKMTIAKRGLCAHITHNFQLSRDEAEGESGNE